MTRLLLSTFVARTGETNTNAHTHVQVSLLLCDGLFSSTLRAKVGELLPHVSFTKIHLQYAKAKEVDGK